MIIVQTPLRVSFLGGGTDFEDFYREYGGAVLSTAIDKYTQVFIKERYDDKIYVNYSKKEIVDDIRNIQHDLVREVAKLTGVSKGFEVSTFVDVREGSGLGSSSSITVGLLQAFYAYKGEFKDASTLAEQACKIEIDTVGKPIGKQDQYITSYGNMRFITFTESGIELEKVPLNKEAKRVLNERLILFFTNRTRKAEDILTEQKSNIPKRIEILNEMKRLAIKGKDALLEGAFDDFGEMLHQGWQLKRQLASKVSNSDLDEVYAVARKNGALGGKITGAGGGGFLLLYCQNGRRDDLRSALRGLEDIPFSFESDGSKIIFNYRK